MKNLAFIVAITLLSGCSGTLYTVVNPNIPTDKEAKIKGVIFYNTINVIELYETTSLVDENSGNLLGSSPEKCTPDKQIKFSTRTNYERPSLIVYEPGLLEKNKFGVTLDKGVLSGVNTESSPSESLADIATLMPFIKAPKANKNMGKGTRRDLPLCNASPKLIGVYRAPDIQSFDAIDQQR